MALVRVLPVLLLRNAGLVKTQQFKNHKYIGDPINAIKIFNEKEVDEMVFLDIMVAKEKKKPNIKIIQDIASECFMPLCYGGGVTSVEIAREILSVGVEKVSINSAAVENPALISELAEQFGRSTVVVSIDVKKNIFGKYKVYTHGGKEKTSLDPVEWAKEVVSRGAGEILINSIDQDGMMKGYDIKLLKAVSDAVNVPVVACGGAGDFSHMTDVVNQTDIRALAAGSFFVFKGKHRAVLITYPTAQQIKSLSDIVKPTNNR